jgi:hypothetical protein
MDRHQLWANQIKRTTEGFACSSCSMTYFRIGTSVLNKSKPPAWPSGVCRKENKASEGDAGMSDDVFRSTDHTGIRRVLDSDAPCIWFEEDWLLPISELL